MVSNQKFIHLKIVAKQSSGYTHTHARGRGCTRLIAINPIYLSYFFLYFSRLAVRMQRPSPVRTSPKQVGAATATAALVAGNSILNHLFYLVADLSRKYFCRPSPCGYSENHLETLLRRNIFFRSFNSFLGEPSVCGTGRSSLMCRCLFSLGLIAEERDRERER